MTLLSIPLQPGVYRRDWHNYWLDVADVIATRATCPRLRVGCVITLHNKIMTTGYNGAPSKSNHCTEVGCDILDNHCLRVIHAEINALNQLQQTSHELRMYVTHKPCEWCITAAGKFFIQEENILWRNQYK
jgi:dCMP deaminase